MIKKTVIIINGVGGVGKDTLCEIVSRHFKTKIISSIDPIKKIASMGGWFYDDKSLGGRRLLSDLKLAFVNYNNLPYNYIKGEYYKFLEDENQFLFVQIREPSEIRKFKQEVRNGCKTLLVKSNRVAFKFGNSSDDNVEDYHYDYIYYNNKSVNELEDDFLEFFKNIVFSI